MYKSQKEPQIQCCSPSKKIKDALVPKKIHLSLRPASLLKRKPCRRCFPVKFAKFLKTFFYRTALGGCFWGSNYSLFLYGNLYRRFYILLSSEKEAGNVIYRIKVWLPLQFIWLEIFYNEESSVLCTIQPSVVVFRGVFECQLRKYVSIRRWVIIPKIQEQW